MSTPAAPAGERRPQETRSRIAPLANLPLFHRLDGRRVLLAGASEPALWKAELLLAAGAKLRITAGTADGGQLYRLLAEQDSRVELLAREWTAADFDGAALAVFGGDGQDAEPFFAAARAAGTPVNVIDRPELCDVQFGTIVNRSPLVIGISTGGGAPMLGQWLRERIEALLPSRLGEWAAAALAWRPQVKQRIAAFAGRRVFWSEFVARAWNHGERAPDSTDFEALLERSPASAGEVILVGAGPGDPALLTLAALRALQKATVILHDDLVSPEILELARREARRVAVGKKGYGRSCRQADINQEIVRLAQAGEIVVRLKGGDPLIFGRATEELDACRAAGVRVSIVPGISAAQGAAASLGISLTEREHARRVQFVTGHGANGELPADIDWRAVADPATTTVVYMPRRTAAHFIARAIAAGLDPGCPAAVVGDASRAGERQLTGIVADVPHLVAALPTEVPAVLIIGEVARPSAVQPLLQQRAAA